MNYRVPDFLFRRYCDKRYFFKLLFTKSGRYCNGHDLELFVCARPGIPANPQYDVAIIEQDDLVSYTNKLSALYSCAKLDLPELEIEVRDLGTGCVLEFLKVIIEE